MYQTSWARGISRRVPCSGSRYLSSTTYSADRCVHLSQRSVLQISGPDAQKFLKGLTSRDVENLQGGYSGFLNASGRVLHTVFIIPDGRSKVPTYYIIHETPSDHPEPLETFLPPFKLRSKVKIRDVSSEWDVWSAWGAKSEPLPHRNFKLGSGGAAEAQWTWPNGIQDLNLKEGELGCWDLRAAGHLARQVLVPKGGTASLLSTHDEGSLDDYHLRRMLLGLPEGSSEIIPEVALPLESCMDIHGGVDFRKGCYLGQELTVRTYHTGATRKRILPIRTSTNASPGEILYHPPSSAPSQRTKSAGKLLVLHGEVGLGLVRLELAEKACWGEDRGRLTVNGEELQVDKGEAYGALDAL